MSLSVSNLEDTWICPSKARFLKRSRAIRAFTLRNFASFFFNCYGGSICNIPNSTSQVYSSKGTSLPFTVTTSILRR